MANCKKCGKPVVAAPVYCPECLEKTGGWISVEDGLPDKLKPVLCWYEYFNYSLQKMSKAYGVGYQILGHWCGDAGTGEKCRVLYWMPLPEPPGKE